MTKKKIIELFKKESNNLSLYKKLHNAHPLDLAKAFMLASNEEKLRFFVVFSPEEMGNIFPYVNQEIVKEYIPKMDKSYVSLMLEQMPIDDASDILNLLNNNEEYYNLMDKDQADDLKEAINYPSDSAGAIMSDDFLYLNVGLGIKEAMKVLVKHAPHKEAIDNLYIVDDSFYLKGILSLNSLICARENTMIKDIMDKNIVSVDVLDNHDIITSRIKDYALISIPVLENGIIKGIITYDDAMDIMDKLSDDDYAKMALIKEGNGGVFSSVKARLPWLAILMVLSLIVSTVIGGFEKVIQQVTVLVFFQTLILDMAGNSATQSLAISVLDLSKNDNFCFKKRLLKELKIGLFDGLLLGLSAFIISYIFLILKDSNYNNFYVGMIIGISIFIGNIISCLIGAIFPSTLSKFKIDPAVASGPLISTVNDILSVCVYYSLALLFMGVLL